MTQSRSKFTQSNFTRRLPEGNSKVTQNNEVTLPKGYAKAIQRLRKGYPKVTRRLPEVHKCTHSNEATVPEGYPKFIQSKCAPDKEVTNRLRFKKNCEILLGIIHLAMCNCEKSSLKMERLES